MPGEVLGVDRGDLLRLVALAARAAGPRPPPGRAPRRPLERRALLARARRLGWVPAPPRPPLGDAVGHEAIVVDRVLEVALEQPLDPRQRALLAHARDVVRAGQRHLRHRRRLDRQRGEVLGLERVDVRLPARARDQLDLDRERVQEVVDALAASSTLSRLRSSGSCVAMPTGQRPVWQW